MKLILPTPRVPILTEEMAQAKANGIEYIELPIAFDALTVVVNQQNNWVTSMTVAELKKIWEPGAQGKITHWNQIRPEWPNEKIALFGAGADSGTFDYFTEAIVGKAKVESWRLHGQRRRQRAGPGSRRKQVCARLHSLRLLRAAQQQDESSCD